VLILGEKLEPGRLPQRAAGLPDQPEPFVAVGERPRVFLPDQREHALDLELPVREVGVVRDPELELAALDCRPDLVGQRGQPSDRIRGVATVAEVQDAMPAPQLVAHERRGESRPVFGRRETTAGMFACADRDSHGCERCTDTRVHRTRRAPFKESPAPARHSRSRRSGVYAECP
jgi:hypothetical protein